MSNSCPNETIEINIDESHAIEITESNNLVTEVVDQSEVIDVVAEGEKGDSAYQIWLSEGNTGSKQDFLDSLSDDGRFKNPIFSYSGSVLSSILYGDGSTKSMEYGSEGELTRLLTTYEGQTKTKEFNYNAQGQLTSILEV